MITAIVCLVEIHRSTFYPSFRTLTLCFREDVDVVPRDQPGAGGAGDVKTPARRKGPYPAPPHPPTHPPCHKTNGKKLLVVVHNRLSA